MYLLLGLSIYTIYLYMHILGNDVGTMVGICVLNEAGILGRIFLMGNGFGWLTTV